MFHIYVCMYVFHSHSSIKARGFPGGAVIKNLLCQCRRHGLDSCVGKIPWRRKWQSSPVFLPGKSHGQRSLVGYSPYGCKELDMTEQMSVHAYTHTHTHTQVMKCNRVELNSDSEMEDFQSTKKISYIITVPCLLKRIFLTRGDES